MSYYDEITFGRKSESLEEKPESDPLLEGGSIPAADSAVIRTLPNMSNYSYLDGLRGIGALVVYLNHFLDHFYHLPTKQKLDEGKDEQLPAWVR